ncbi:MAG TPA: hypothetical protein VL574_08520 [Stellaceae bacterium]|jgi:hypothetical protein|nr:hypothetical protein [Stellaceae bacterium]
MDRSLQLIFDTTVQGSHSDSWVIAVMALVSLIPLIFCIIAVVMRMRRARHPAGPRLDGMPETSLRGFVLIIAITLIIGIAFATTMYSGARVAYDVHRHIRDKDYALRDGTVAGYVLVGIQQGYATDRLTLEGGISFELSCSSAGLHRRSGLGYCLPLHPGEHVKIAYIPRMDGKPEPMSEPLLIWKLP